MENGLLYYCRKSLCNWGPDIAQEFLANSIINVRVTELGPGGECTDRSAGFPGLVLPDKAPGDLG